MSESAVPLDVVEELEAALGADKQAEGSAYHVSHDPCPVAVPAFGAIWHGRFREFGSHKAHFGISLGHRGGIGRERRQQGGGPAARFVPVTTKPATGGRVMTMAPGELGAKQPITKTRSRLRQSYVLFYIVLPVGVRLLVRHFEPRGALSSERAEEARAMLRAGGARS